jgi:hypothetical protein
MDAQHKPKSRGVAARWPLPAGVMGPISVDPVPPEPPPSPPVRSVGPGSSHPPARVRAGNELAIAIMAAAAFVILAMAAFGVGALWTAVVQHYP